MIAIPLPSPAVLRFAYRASLLLLAALPAIDQATGSAAGQGAAGASASPGRIVVAHDDWTLSNTGFSAASSTPQFARNVANWFTGGQLGKFRVWSSNFGLVQSSLAQTMTGANHQWTVSTAGAFDLPTLLQYDALFLAGGATGVDNAVLVSYVQAGGCVYLAGGTTNANTDATRWDTFLHAFGLEMGNLNGLVGNYAISNNHPLFSGVTALYHNNGNSLSDLDSASATNQVLITSGASGLYAVYDGSMVITTYCTAKPNSLGCVPAIGYNGVPSISSTAPFAVTASAVINNKNGLLFYGYQPDAVPFENGTLCIAPPLKRTVLQSSGGNPPPNDCSGAYSIDFNAFAQESSDPNLVVGATVYAQYWMRDPGSAGNIGLSEGLRFVLAP